mmetsp:Transcript_33413/g.105900  ORF Transcript_33413/g.105900 Transcript_33413/m.105900 type:complete len:215 (-) Transcript_33413:1167-1811(-)
MPPPPPLQRPARPPVAGSALCGLGARLPLVLAEASLLPCHKQDSGLGLDGAEALAEHAVRPCGCLKARHSAAPGTARDGRACRSWLAARGDEAAQLWPPVCTLVMSALRACSSVRLPVRTSAKLRALDVATSSMRCASPCSSAMMQACMAAKSWRNCARRSPGAASAGGAGGLKAVSPQEVALLRLPSSLPSLRNSWCSRTSHLSIFTLATETA